jgi:tRNA pseudouridine55 synthase
MLSGILNVDKPRGLTSHDVVDAIRTLTGLRAVGHTGTLDPDASGILLLCLGRATKFARFFEPLDKTYWAVLRLGICTDTQDATGTITQQCAVPPLSLSHVEHVLQQFVGAGTQIPPMYSAVKYRGKRLYRLARHGQVVPREARKIMIKRLALLDMRGPWVTIAVTCSKGTYIRTLCEDIGRALRCGAHMAHLQRCAIGPFGVHEAYTLAWIRQHGAPADLTTTCIPLAQAFTFLPALSLTSQEYARVHTERGRALPQILRTHSLNNPEASCYRLCTQADETVAIMHRHPAAPHTWKLQYIEHNVLQYA